ncbi:HHR045Cp [Eremothecium sinecaudum]|uniref:HHR045Cp n=1 Tax=Eremothecium sinecaudum TaxID=45286 RepID=A0A0X8HWH9_9SACH|nr:HHR045Cp [Eremothecium sinecaudum]AMD22814.1 HHR045Cp [Eremothecium sinecaudum]
MSGKLILRRLPGFEKIAESKRPVGFNTPVIKGVPTKDALIQLRGVLSPIRTYQYSSNLRSTESCLYSCPFFDLNYYPPEHFLALARKSRPALQVTFADLPIFNANIDPTKSVDERIQMMASPSVVAKLKQLEKILQQPASKNPRDWAYLRISTSKFFRKQFLNVWCGLPQADYPVLPSHDPSSKRPVPGCAKDGLYHFNIRLLPGKGGSDECAEHIQKSLTHVTNLDWDSLLCSKNGRIPWPRAINQKVNINAINWILHKDRLPYKYVEIQTA